MGRYIVSRPELVHDEARVEVEQLNARLTPSLGFYAVVLALAAVAPAVAAVGFLAVALLSVIRG